MFHCYEVEGLPRTNNDLEQYFGCYRCIERRITGHKGGSSMTVVRGPVRIISCAATAARPFAFAAADLVPIAFDSYRTQRQNLEGLRELRRMQCRFRLHPNDYLERLEEMASPATLPS